MKTFTIAVDDLSLASSQLGPSVMDRTFYDGTVLTGDDDAIDKVSSLDMIVARRNLLIEYTAARRFSVETGGINVQGVKVATDRESQSLINGAFSLVQVDPARTFSFKTSDGFVTLNAQQITGIAMAVATHVQTCFSTEASVVQKIENGEVHTQQEVDQAFVASDPE